MDDFFWPEKPSRLAFPLAKAGYPLIFASAFITGVFALLELTVLALLGVIATLFICYFFRDPDRVIPRKQGAIVSPADGKVIKVKTITDGRFIEGNCLKELAISLMSLNAEHKAVLYGIDTFAPGDMTRFAGRCHPTVGVVTDSNKQRLAEMKK